MQRGGTLWLIGLMVSGCYAAHERGERPRSRPDLGVADLAVPSDPVDASVPSDLGSPDPCAPQRVVRTPCFECDDITGAFWNGESCLPLACNCEGPDCDATYESVAECEAVRAACAPVLCRATEGRWLPERRYCGSPECGRDLADCARGAPSCHCGPARRFDRSSGCTADACTPADEATLCGESGGRWAPVCCPSRCGESCGDDCAAMACECPPSDVWDPEHGCVRSAECLAPAGPREACDLELVVGCGPRLVCCPTSEGPRCRQPLCDEDDLGCFW